MADQSTLLNGLREYRDTLTKHVTQLREGYEIVAREWTAFEHIYEGDAAYEFKDLWMRTGENFQEYMERSQRIIKMLDERIIFLQAANQDESSGG